MEFFDRLKKWLDTAEENKDYAEGALLLLKINRNQIIYQQNMMFLADKVRQQFITYELQKRYEMLLQGITHQQVNEMQAQVDKIAEKHHLEKTEQPEFKKGKRIDHDKLPKEIQQLYVDNLGIRNRMREVHLQLRHLSKSEHICPDNDRYPFLKELIELDKRMHSYWERYDTYELGKVAEPKKAPVKKVAKKTTTKKATKATSKKDKK